jgi:hypothetical protein
MAQSDMTKVKIALGSVRIAYEGREDFLKSDLMRLVQEFDKLGTVRSITSAKKIQVDVEEALIYQKDVAQEVSNIKNDLDSLSDIGETESLRLQMAMDRLSKMMSTLSNLLKKVSDTASEITQNLK